jgi:O-antigen ligase
MARSSPRDRTRGHHTGKSSEGRPGAAGGHGARDAAHQGGRQDALQSAPQSARQGARHGSRQGARQGTGRAAASGSSSSSASASRAPETTALRIAAWLIVVLLIVTPLVVMTDLKEGFRLPSFTDFAIGVACAIGWSLAFTAPSLRRLLVWTIPPAVVVAALGVDQALGWFGTLDWLHVQAPTARLRITSTVGNPGDLAGLLVLPTLIAVEEIAGASRRRRALLAGALIVMTAALIVTATLAAVVAIVVGLAVWTLPRLWPGAAAIARGPSSTSATTSRASVSAAADANATIAARVGDAAPVRVFRRRRMTVLLAGALVLALAIAGLAASTPLRARVSEKVMQLASGDFNALLTGRLDGWRAAWAMLRAEPVTGVGQGAFRAEYADTRLALEAQGVTFLAEQQQVVMATPHNEALSVAAEQGIPGLVALAWAMWCVIASAVRMGLARDRSEGSDRSEDADGAARVERAARAVRAERAVRSDRIDATDIAHDRTLAATGLAALGVLSLVSFPLHVPAIAWPWLLFLAWIFRAAGAGTRGVASDAGAGVDA